MNYRDQLCEAMRLLSENDRVVFLGQAVAAPGTAMFDTMKHVTAPRIELPVAEEMQLGMSIGMALAGGLPVAVFPRWNFLLLATNQLVNHLDKLPIYSNGGYRPKVIIRTAVASEDPLYPGAQHIGNFTKAFRGMCRTVEFVELRTPDQIVPEYEKALERDGSTVLVEWIDKYGMKL